MLDNVGLTGIEPIDYDGKRIVPVQFLARLLPDPATLPGLDDDDNVRISNDVTDTSVRVNRCRVSWHFETGTSPDNVPLAAIYQLYGLDLAGKWFDLNQWTLPVIDMPHHIIAKVSTRYYGISKLGWGFFRKSSPIKVCILWGTLDMYMVLLIKKD